jgi:4-hydroxy-3-polyprenylbenzoate decarboxylase
MHAIWGTGLLSLTKGVIVVDEHVDVHDYAQVLWQVGANVDPARDVVLSSGPLDHLDHAPTRQFVGGKIGFDATETWEAEGYTRGWPEIARMDEAVAARVEARWAELGIPAGARAGGSANGAGPSRRRRVLPWSR